MFPSQKYPVEYIPPGSGNASMGPGCFHPRNRTALCDELENGTLQWGRDVSIPEIRLAEAGTKLHASNASMWPGCFHPRNTVASPLSYVAISASMGPGCFHPRNQRHAG